MNEIKTHPYNFQLVPVGQINVDHLYQRDKVSRTVKGIINNFDYHKVNPIKCVFRDGEYFTFDGQNTAVGLCMKFGAKYLAPVLLYDDIPSWVDEAKLFEEINSKSFRKAVTVVEGWISRVNRGEETATGIKNIVNSHGLSIPGKVNKKGNGVIKALTALENAYNFLGDKLFDEEMDILSSAWGGNPDSLTAPILMGLARFVKTYYGDYNKKNLTNRLHNVDPKSIIIAGKSSMEGGNSKYAREILAVYNKYTTSNRLPNKLV